MPASRNNLATCDNCKQILIVMLNQSGQREFCCDYCADEWAAEKRADAVLPSNLAEVIDRVRSYMAAIKSNQGIMVALGALIVAAAVCWPQQTPPALSLVPASGDDADKKTPRPPRPTLFREQEEAAEAVAAEPSPTAEPATEPESASTPAASSDAPVSASDESPASPSAAASTTP